MTVPPALLGVAVVLIVTPGQDTVLTVRNALAGGRGGGICTALGVSAGQAIWTVAASAGIVAVISASAPLFTAIRLAGVAYLILLGTRGLYAALRGGGELRHGAVELPQRRPAPAGAFRQGLFSNLGNPKMALFFTSLLPQFAPGGRPSLTTLLLVGLVFCTLTLIWLSGYSFLIARVGDVARRPSVRRVVEGVSGATLVALGLRLAAEDSLTGM